MTTKNKILVGVGAAVIIAGAIYLYKKAKKVEQPTGGSLDVKSG